MNKKIAILRGINVGGKRKILMADLKLMFEQMNFSNVKTYIQSGNVFFDTEKDDDNLKLSQEIEAQINKDFNLEVPVVVKTSEEIEVAIKQNPFYKQDVDIAHLHLTFLHKNPKKEHQHKTETYNYEPDKFQIQGNNVFIYCEGKYHKSKLTNNFFEKNLEVNATTRNWKTVLKLYELSK